MACYGSDVSGIIIKLVLHILSKCANIVVLGTRVLTVVKERETHGMWGCEENGVGFELAVLVGSNNSKSHRPNDTIGEMSKSSTHILLSEYYHPLCEPDLLAEMADADNGTGKTQSDPRVSGCVRKKKI